MTVLAGALSTAANRSIGPSGAGTYQIAATKYTAVATGSATTMSLNWWYNNAGNTVTLAIYDSTATSLLGTTNAVSISVGTLTGTLGTPVSLVAGVDYWLAAIYSAANSSMAVRTNGDGTDTLAQSSNTSYAFPASIGTSGGGNNSGKMAITADGTPTSAPVPITSILPQRNRRKTGRFM